MCVLQGVFTDEGDFAVPEPMIQLQPLFPSSSGFMESTKLSMEPEDSKLSHGERPERARMVVGASARTGISPRGTKLSQLSQLQSQQGGPAAARGTAAVAAASAAGGAEKSGGGALTAAVGSTGKSVDKQASGSTAAGATGTAGGLEIVDDDEDELMYENDGEDYYDDYD